MLNPSIQLTDDAVKNIQIMAPHLSERQQYIVFGMILANMENSKSTEKKTA